MPRDRAEGTPPSLTRHACQGHHFGVGRPSCVPSCALAFQRTPDHGGYGRFCGRKADKAP